MDAVNNRGFRARPEISIGQINVRMNGIWATDYYVRNACLHTCKCVYARARVCVPVCVCEWSLGRSNFTT